MDEQEQEQNRQKGGGGLFRFLWVLGLALLLYVGTIGPAMKSRLGDYRFVQHLYDPLYALCYRVPAAERLLSWYLFSVWNAPVRE